MKKCKKITFALVAFFLINVTVASASTVQSPKLSKERKAMVEYLDAVKNKDIQKAVKLSNDIRVGSEEEQVKLLEEVIAEESNQIKSYQIKDEYILNGDHYFDLLIKYNNNNKEEANLRVSNSNGDYIVNVGQTVCADKKNIGKDTFNSTIDSEVMLPRISARGSFIMSYSISKFTGKAYTSTFNSTSDIWINAKQYGTTSSYEGKVQYSIVKKGILFDSSYASATLTRNSETGSEALYLSPGAISGVCLKVQNIGAGDSSDGSRYPITVIGEVYSR